MLSRRLRALEQIGNGISRMHTASQSALGPSAAWPSAFVFDIDGVLKRGKEVLPQAIRALEQLYSPDKQMPRLPVAFLTNGGGVTERRKALQLTDWLGVNVAPEQVVLSHTPFRPLAPKYAHQPVLIVGRGHIVEVAKHYGFKNIITTSKLAKALPTAVPFWKESSVWSSGPSADRYYPPLRYGTPEDPIRAVFVFSDPEDWYKDLQLVSDVLVGRGVLSRRHEEVPPDAPPVAVYFSNPDLLWANEHPSPRFGQGAFAACVEALYERVTGSHLPSKTVFGKPNPEPYRLIETLLAAQASSLGLLPTDHVQEFPRDTKGLPMPPFSSIYAIGDNSAADVRGANQAGHPWKSILVRTGVFSGPHANCLRDPAHIVVDDVEAAVKAAMHHSRSVKWHSMR